MMILMAGSMVHGQYTVGVKAGANLANLSGSSVKNNSMLIGYNLGGLFNYSMEDAISGSFGKIFSLQAELLIETKGANADFEFQDTTLAEVDQEFTYVTIPILAKFSFGAEDHVRVFGAFGVYGSSLFGLKIDGEVARDHDNKPGTDDRKYREEYTGFDFGAMVAAGTQIPLSDKWGIIVQGRYALGLNSIGEFKNTSTDIPESQLEEIKTNTIGVSAGVVYKIK